MAVAGLILAEVTRHIWEAVQEARFQRDLERNSASMRPKLSLKEVQRGTAGEIQGRRSDSSG